MEGATQSDFENRCHFILLHCSQYLFGLSSANVASPLTISATSDVQNRCRYAAASQIATAEGDLFQMINASPCAAQPCMVNIYTNGIFTLAEGNGVVSGLLAGQNDATAALYRAAQESTGYEHQRSSVE